MSTALVLGCVWVLAATLLAMLPMRRQLLPGLALLLAAPVLVAFIGWQHGWGWAGLALAGVLSMFRKPLAHVWLRLRGAPEDRVE